MRPDLTYATRRQYVFRTRRCRQRIAQALGAGRDAVAVAAVERLPLVEVTALARDPSLASLVGHYRELAALDAGERRARLLAAAAAMLERLVATGDLRAVAFVLHEEARGRDPAAELAEAVWQDVERVGARDAVDATPPGQPDPPSATGPAAESRSARVQRAAPRRTDDRWRFCAAVQPDGEAAAALGAGEAAGFPQRLRAMAAGLRRLVMADLEREGTAATAMPALRLATDAAAIGRALHHRPEQAFGAAIRLERLSDDPTWRGEAPEHREEAAFRSRDPPVRL